MSRATSGFALAALLLYGCLPIPEDEYNQDMDGDHDSVPWPRDCDPNDSTVGEVGTVNLYVDRDDDGYGDDDEAPTLASCADLMETPAGFSRERGDCNDDDAAIHPSAEEVCDGVDNNCDHNAADADATCQESGIVPVTGDVRSLSGSDGAMAGAGMAVVLDGDGSPAAVAVSAPSADATSPRVYVVELYDDDQAPLWQDDLILGGSEANRSLSTTQESTRLGHALKAADLDGAGRQELLVGAPGWETDDQELGGAVWLLADGEAPEGGGAINIEGQGALVGPEGALLGYAMGVLTANESGQTTLAFGGPGLTFDPESPDQGGVVLLSAEALADLMGVTTLSSAQDAVVILATDPLTRAGAAVSDGGDLTGDGVDDLLVGASSSRGAAWLLDGAELLNSGSLDDGLVRYEGYGNADELGAAVLISPDINGDGLDDAVIGAPGATVSGGGTGGIGAGKVYVVAGGTALAGTANLEERALVVFLGDREDAGLGSALAGPGDLDGDAGRAGSDAEGRSDLALGAPGAAGSGVGSGAVYIAYGPLTSERVSVADTLPEIVGQTPGDALGSALGPTPDLTCEGNPDLLMGAPWAALGDGAVYLYGSGLDDTTRRAPCSP